MTDRAKLIDYAKHFLKVTCRPDEAIAVTVEQVVGFAELLRNGCHQDLKRLIVNAIDDCPDDFDGKSALKCLGEGIEGHGTESWGLPDCSCGKGDCVYCGVALNLKIIERENENE
jgi:hypothetical protein